VQLASSDVNGSIAAAATSTALCCCCCCWVAVNCKGDVWNQSSARASHSVSELTLQRASTSPCSTDSIVRPVAARWPLLSYRPPANDQISVLSSVLPASHSSNLMRRRLEPLVAIDLSQVRCWIRTLPLKYDFQCAQFLEMWGGYGERFKRASFDDIIFGPHRPRNALPLNVVVWSRLENCF